MALLESGLFVTRSGGLIADLVMCTPILAVSGYRIERYFLRVVQLMTTMGVVFPFRGVLLSLAHLPLGQKKMVDLHMLLIFLFPVKKYVHLDVYIFILYVNNNNAYISQHILCS